MKRVVSLLLCLILFVCTIPAPARADDDRLFYTTVVCRRYPEGASIQLLAHNDRIYIETTTAGVLVGMNSQVSRPDKVTFFSGDRQLTYEGEYISAHDSTWYPLEALMDVLNTRAVASASKLYLNDTNPALTALDAAMADYENIVVGVNPDDKMNKIGLGLSKFYDIVSNFALTDLFDHRYEREMYRSAMYALLRRSDDDSESTISDLCYYGENEIISPLIEFYDGMEEMFGESIMTAFYAGTELEELKQILDMYEAVKDTIGMSPGDYVAMVEELSFFNGAYTAGAEGIEYLLECSPKDDTEELLLEVMKQILGTYKGVAEDEIRSILMEPIYDLGAAYIDETYKTYMLGLYGSAMLSGVDAIMQALPGMSAMDHLEMSAVYYQIQEFAARQIKKAYREGDLIRLKYAGIVYYRCAYLFGVEMENMGDDMLEVLARDFQAIASEREAQLLTISDSMLMQSAHVNDPIPASAFLGPVMDYIRVYENLLQNFGELNVKDYYGTEYIEEGSGIIAPWLHQIKGYTLLTVLRQEGSDLIQMVFLDDDNSGDLNLVDERVVLTCGANGSVYYAFDNEAGLLLSCVSYDLDLTSYAWNGESVEAFFYEADDSADSISAMRMSAWERLYMQFDRQEPAVEVDGSDGLFTISRSPAELREIFLQRLNSL